MAEQLARSPLRDMRPSAFTLVGLDGAPALACIDSQPNPSIERTSSSVLRTLPAAAHVKR
jgi:hypothetical protein